MRSHFKALLPPIAKSGRSLLAHPFHFLGLQIPAASYLVVEYFLRDALGNETIATLAGTPYLFIASTFSTAATFASVAFTPEGTLSALQSTCNRVRAQWKILALASLVIGFITLVGMLALLLPGLYFAALYLFVPHLILSEPGQNLWAYLDRSKRLSRPRIFLHIGVVLFTLILMVWVYVVGDMSTSLFGSELASSSIAIGLSLVVQMFLSMVVGCLVDVWLSHYFLELKGASNESPSTTP